MVQDFCTSFTHYYKYESIFLRKMCSEKGMRDNIIFIQSVLYQSLYLRATKYISLLPHTYSIHHVLNKAIYLATYKYIVNNIYLTRCKYICVTLILSRKTNILCM